MVVIEGDMTTELDAERLRSYNVPVIAINTGRSCHLDSKMVSGGIHRFATEYQPSDYDLVWVENVGNLVCPAEFEVGEHAKVALLSVTEGEDKPIKYPNMFETSQVCIINKIDLLPYLDFDKQKAIDFIHQVHPQMPVFEISAKTEEGFEAWIKWLKNKIRQKA